jgi:hypothetical protein
MKRREFFRTAGIASATLASLPGLAGTLANSAPARTGLDGKPADKFTILVAGLYKPVVNCPDLGLSTVNVCDGSFVTNRIYPVNGLPLDDSGEDNRVSRLSSPACQAPIGRFYVQLASLRYCAYDLPGGALAMAFTGNTLVSVPDTAGGAYLVGTIDLDITEATGIYQSFVGGHNTMVDIGRALADGSFIDNCFCNISRP